MKLVAGEVSHPGFSVLRVPAGLALDDLPAAMALVSNAFVRRRG